jgi:hypothetical protein
MYKSQSSRLLTPLPPVLVVDDWAIRSTSDGTTSDGLLRASFYNQCTKTYVNTVLTYRRLISTADDQRRDRSSTVQ